MIHNIQEIIKKIILTLKVNLNSTMAFTAKLQIVNEIKFITLLVRGSNP